VQKVLFRLVEQVVSVERKLTDAALMQISHSAGNGIRLEERRPALSPASQGSHARRSP
jgi:hypothetical protein